MRQKARGKAPPALSKTPFIFHESTGCRESQGEEEQSWRGSPVLGTLHILTLHPRQSDLDFIPSSVGRYITMTMLESSDEERRSDVIEFDLDHTANKPGFSSKSDCRCSVPALQEQSYSPAGLHSAAPTDISPGAEPHCPSPKQPFCLVLSFPSCLALSDFQLFLLCRGSIRNYVSCPPQFALPDP